MKSNTLGRFGAFGAALALAGAGLVTTATQASAATPLVFDINGTYSDGGTARPVISNANDILTVDMSSQHRPNASGVVINSDTILITFPDDATYTAKLQPPSTIRWSNGSTWTKTVLVPNVLDKKEAQAKSILNAAGFAVSVVKFPDTLCNNIGSVATQNPGAGASALPGATVTIRIGVRPPTPCK
jgi:hypothetical protein